MGKNLVHTEESCYLACSKKTFLVQVLSSRFSHCSVSLRLLTNIIKCSTKNAVLLCILILMYLLAYCSKFNPYVTAVPIGHIIILVEFF